MATAADRRQYQEVFGEFYRVYPRHVDQLPALDAFVAAIQEGFDPAEIIAKAESYARNVNPSDLRYVPSPKAWLRDRKWTDEDLFTDARVNSREWFIRAYREADAATVQKRYGYVYPDPAVPDDCVNVEAFHRDSRKLWIAGIANHVLNSKPLPE